MKKTAIIITILYLCAFGSISAQVVGTPYIIGGAAGGDPELVCEDITTKGTDFWVTFGTNNRYYAVTVSMFLQITAEEATNVTLVFTEGGSTANYSVPANSSITVDMSNVQGTDRREAVYSHIYVDCTTCGLPSSGKNSKSLHITSNKPVSVYALNAKQYITDATVILPVTVWGDRYYRLSYKSDWRNPGGVEEFDVEMVIARENGTTITTADGTQTLNAGQVYYRSGSKGGDNTGNMVTSNKPVAYFAHNTGAKIPAGYTASPPTNDNAVRNWQDILFEQMMPVNRWGKQFLVPNANQKHVTNVMNNRIRIMAAENATAVNFYGATRVGGQSISSGGTLNAGQWVELHISNSGGACYIDAGKPVGVCSYLVGSGLPHGNTNINGDPAIAWIPPVNMMTPSALITPMMINASDGSNTHFAGASSEHYIIIIAKKDAKTETAINGLPVASGWTDNTDSDYSYYLKRFNNPADKNKTFKIDNPYGVIVLGYGLANNESYYYNAGSGGCIRN